MPHLVGREHRPARQLRLAAVAVDDGHQAGNVADAVALQVGAGDDTHDALRLRRGGCLDLADAGVGMRRAEHISVGLARQHDIVGVAAVARDEAPILGAAHRLTHPKLNHLAASSRVWRGRICGLR